ncbi:hypothetical protein Tco_0897646 [Tanacetum coccineum]
MISPSVGNTQDMHTQPTDSEDSRRLYTSVSNTKVRTVATDGPSSKGSGALLEQLETTNDPQLWVTVEKEAVHITFCLPHGSFALPEIVGSFLCGSLALPEIVEFLRASQIMLLISIAGSNCGNFAKRNRNHYGSKEETNVI